MRLNKNDNKLHLRIDNLELRINAVVRELGVEIEELQRDVTALTKRVTALENEEPQQILTGEVMMKDYLTYRFGPVFLNRVPINEAQARMDVKDCRDALAEYYSNVDLPWPDSATRHFDAFQWLPITFTGGQVIIDFIHDQESLKSIVSKWQWIEVE